MSAVKGLTSLGYIRRRFEGKRIFEHVYVAENALGRKLPPKAIVHHVNLDGTDNRPCNLVICPDQKYHFLLHSRTAALDACGHADWRPCWICGVYSPIGEMTVYNRAIAHRVCDNAYQRKLALKRKSK